MGEVQRIQRGLRHRGHVGFIMIK